MCTQSLLMRIQKGSSVYTEVYVEMILQTKFPLQMSLKKVSPLYTKCTNKSTERFFYVNLVY
jgi:hypothetical protein